VYRSEAVVTHLAATVLAKFIEFRIHVLLENDPPDVSCISEPNTSHLRDLVPLTDHLDAISLALQVQHGVRCFL
jgi:hypothetical protein